MKKVITTAMMLSGLVAYAQGKVGINTNTPTATLDIQPITKNALLTATTNEGVLIPRLSKSRIAKIKDKALVKGTMVYINDIAYTDSPANLKVENILAEGFHYYDGAVWQPVQKDNTKFEYILSRDGSVLVQWMDKYKEIEVDMNNYPDMANVKFIGTNLFTASKIKKFIIKEGVTTIGDRAVYSSPDTEVIFPSSIIEIKPDAFYNNQKLNTLHLPNAKIIERGAFIRTSLKSVDLPEVTHLSEEAFRDNTLLTSASLPKLISLERGTFGNTPMLSQVDFSSVQTVKTDAFFYQGSNNNKLNSISLPSATLIESYAFRGLTNVMNLDMPEAITIENYAYSDRYGYAINESLKTLNIPKAQTIGEYAFSGNAITTLNLAAAKIIKKEAFRPGYSSSGMLKTLNIPLAETIENSAFINNAITTLNLSNARTIEASAFSGTGTLTSLSVPLLETIGNRAFSGNKLTSLDLPLAKTIGVSAFSGHYNYHPNGYDQPAVVTDQRTLTSLKAPIVESIGNAAFYKHKLASINLPKVKTIEDYAFSVGYFSNPYRLSDIGTDAQINFSNHPRTLTSLSLPKVETIGDFAFEGHNLTSLSLPEVKTIGRYAFAAGEVEGVHHTDNIDARTLTNLTLPKAETIGKGAFSHNRLKTLNLPNIKDIGDGAFANCFNYGDCSLTNVTIGPNITQIGGQVFSGRYYSYQKNVTITIQATTPPTFAYEALPSIYSPYKLTVRVPSASVAAYQAALAGKIQGDYVVVGY